MLTSEDPVHKKQAKLVAKLAAQGVSEIGPNDECCAYCQGISMDVAQPPVSARKLKKMGRGCPLSIIAYRGAAEMKKGAQVDVVPQPGGVPVLQVNGEIIDALEDYRAAGCGCEE